MGTQPSAPQAHCGREQSGERGAQASPDDCHSPWGRSPARCPDGCGRGLHSALVSGTCLARGRAGRSGFRKVGAPAERTACADRGPGGLGGLAPHPEGHGLGCSEEQR